MFELENFHIEKAILSAGGITLEHEHYEGNGRIRAGQWKQLCLPGIYG